MKAAKDGEWDAQGGIAALVQALGGNDLDDAGFVFENPADEVDAQSSHPGGLLD